MDNNELNIRLAAIPLLRLNNPRNYNNIYDDNNILNTLIIPPRPTRLVRQTNRPNENWVDPNNENMLNIVLDFDEENNRNNNNNIIHQ